MSTITIKPGLYFRVPWSHWECVLKAQDGDSWCGTSSPDKIGTTHWFHFRKNTFGGPQTWCKVHFQLTFSLLLFCRTHQPLIRHQVIRLKGLISFKWVLSSHSKAWWFSFAADVKDTVDYVRCIKTEVPSIQVGRIHNSVHNNMIQFNELTVMLNYGLNTSTAEFSSCLLWTNEWYR